MATLTKIPTELESSTSALVEHLVATQPGLIRYIEPFLNFLKTKQVASGSERVFHIIAFKVFDYDICEGNFADELKLDPKDIEEYLRAWNHLEPDMSNPGSKLLAQDVGKLALDVAMNLDQESCQNTLVSKFFNWKGVHHVLKDDRNLPKLAQLKTINEEQLAECLGRDKSFVQCRLYAMGRKVPDNNTNRFLDVIKDSYVGGFLQLIDDYKSSPTGDGRKFLCEGLTDAIHYFHRENDHFALTVAIYQIFGLDISAKRLIYEGLIGAEDDYENDGVRNAVLDAILSYNSSQPGTQFRM